MSSGVGWFLGDVGFGGKTEIYFAGWSLFGFNSEGRGGGALARAIAGEVGEGKAAVRALVRELFGDDVEVRKRAADVARRIRERDGRPLEPYADELAGLLETLPLEESRTRWHLGMVVPRVAHTRAQRLRAARTMSLLAEDESNVV